MENKKTTKANLETTKMTNWLMGVIVALAVLFVSFEWGTQPKTFDYVSSGVIDDHPLPPITFPDPPDLPPPPPPKVESDVAINVVDNDTDMLGPDVKGTEDDDAPIPPKPPMPSDFGGIDVPEAPADDYIVEFAEIMPEFPGGNAALMSFIAQTVKYPVTALERGIDGNVVCSFVVDKDGSITNVEVMRGIDVSLDREALRVIGLMPKWKPGMQGNKAVRVKYTIPIMFKLQK